MATFTRPSALSVSGAAGYYSGTTVTVSGGSSSLYIYAATSATGTYYRKGTGTSMSIDADTSSTSAKTVYVTLCSENIGSSFSGSEYGMSSTYYRTVSVPRFKFRYYYNGSTRYIKTGSTGSFTITPAVGTYVGLATSSTSSTASISSRVWTTVGPTVDGNIYYVVSAVAASSTTEEETISYYLGTDAAQSLTATKTVTTARAIYNNAELRSGGGTTTTRDAVTEPDSTCLADDSYLFLAWQTDADDTTGGYATMNGAWQAGYTTLYGLYSKTEPITYYPQNGDEAGSLDRSCTLYGTGSRLCVNPDEPSVTNGSAVLLGWAETASGTPTTWSEAIGDENTVVYALWLSSGFGFLGIGGTARKVGKVYIGVNGIARNVTKAYVGVENIARQI